jgi:hypothetical protein
MENRDSEAVSGREKTRMIQGTPRELETGIGRVSDFQEGI